MNKQQQPRSLDGILFALLLADFTTFWISVFCPKRYWSPDDDSSFAHFWYGFWWLLTAYWMFALVLAALNRRGSHLHYGAGWIAYFLYDFLSRHDPVQMSRLGSLMNLLNIFLGGACLTMLFLRHHRIGHWLQHSIVTHFRRRRSADEQPASTLPTP
jgi:hypothetical protein